MIDIAALRSLVAVRDHGSIVAAAAALGFTPSAISQQIKKLERQSRGPACRSSLRRPAAATAAP